MRIDIKAGLLVDALSKAEVIQEAVRLVADKQNTGAHLITAMHVGGLSHFRNKEYTAALAKAELICADGASVVLLARMKGVKNVERAATTDVGLDILKGSATALNRRVRVALLGGQDGLAERAGAVLQLNCDVDIVFTEHGYHTYWTHVIEALRASMPDVILVGLGSPKETIWAWQVMKDLPGATIVTCGGWFGHLTGAEYRAPLFLQRAGLEWTVRLVQAPGRLARRYAIGLLWTIHIALSTIIKRAANPSRR